MPRRIYFFSLWKMNWIWIIGFLPSDLQMIYNSRNIFLIRIYDGREKTLIHSTHRHHIPHAYYSKSAERADNDLHLASSLWAYNTFAPLSLREGYKAPVVAPSKASTFAIIRFFSDSSHGLLSICYYKSFRIWWCTLRAVIERKNIWKTLFSWFLIATSA